MNSYTTALALNSHSDLPPSPISPMTSAMGIDPKWEFPRENITLQDELAVGQFTVLYKATARGLKDNRLCDITVKSLKGEDRHNNTAAGRDSAVPMLPRYSFIKVFMCTRCGSECVLFHL